MGSLWGARPTRLLGRSHNGYFVDLFVRASNDVAKTLYEKLGYVVYRTVLKYYSANGDTAAEDAYGGVGCFLCVVACR